MLNLKKVLVVIEPDKEDQPALDKVLALEKLVELEIKLVACDYTQYLVEGYYFDAVDIPRLRKEYLYERKQALEAIAEPLREGGLVVETDAFWGHPGYEILIREAVSYGADLIIHHTRRHSALSRMFLTNDDWQLVRCSPVPLLLVKEKPWKANPSILVAVDPMHARHKPQGLDHKLLVVAKTLSEMTKGDLFVMHSYAQIPLSGTYLKEAKESHEKAFNELADEFDVNRSQRYLMSEAPEYGLCELEKDIQADLIVMGAISRSLLHDVFIGNTTEKVLDYLETDVLIIKPDDYVSPVK